MRSKQETVLSSYSLLLNQLLTEYNCVVPVIAIFTKFDDLVKQIYDKNMEMDENCRVALAALDAKFQVPLSKFRFPPKAYLRLESVFNVLFSIGYGDIDFIDIRNAKEQW